MKYAWIEIRDHYSVSRLCRVLGVRGHVKILDRAKLEAEACECYANVRQQFKRVLGIPYG